MKKLIKLLSCTVLLVLLASCKVNTVGCRHIKTVSAESLKAMTVNEICVVDDNYFEHGMSMTSSTTVKRTDLGWFIRVGKTKMESLTFISNEDIE